MRKFVSFFVIMMLISIFTASLMAQPQYYNYMSGINNSFPLNVETGKMIQTLIVPGEFSNPTPAPAGNITILHLRIGDALGPATYTDFKIFMGQTTDLVLTSGAFYSGPLTEVYSNASVTFTAAADSWLSIPLDVPFTYDPGQSLVIQIEQRGVTGSFTGYSLNQTSTPSRRIYSLGGYPFAYGGIQDRVSNCGVTIAPPYNAPELIYYKFEDNPSATTIKNCATTPVGTNPATISTATLGPGGEFDTCLISTNSSGSGVTTGWNFDLGASSWTISFWCSISTAPSANYVFGDNGASTFRCFVGGVAPTNGIILRGTGITDVEVNGVMPGPSVVTFVYDATIPDIKAYLNGVLAATVPQTALNLAVGTGFKVGGYSSSTSFAGNLDEFKLYNRALDAVEIAATWNIDMPGCTAPVGINNIYSNTSFELMQNYPNPLNQYTTISYQISSKSDVVLKVFDIMGKEVTTLVNANQVAGKYEVKFDASGLAAGIYLYQLTTKDFSISKRMNVEK